jgi:hypothetical protein
MEFTKVNSDIDFGRNISESGSPKVIYTTFLLGLLREFFGLVISGTMTKEQIEDGFSCLIAFCPDKVVRGKIWNNYLERVKANSGKPKSAAILSCGELIDYFTEVLELTSTSTGGFL